MSLSESLIVSVFMLSIVFVVLIALSLIIKIQSHFFKNLEEKRKKALDGSMDNKINGSLASSENNNIVGNVVEVANGELTLVDVDEKTAAMIMAIVSDEMEVPLSELQFKYIKAI